MPRSRRNAPVGAPSLPQREVQGAGLPTPPEEYIPSSDETLADFSVLDQVFNSSATPQTKTSPPLDVTASDRSETRSLRQQIACMDEHIENLTSKMTRLQEQTTEAHRLLAQERLERLEERNNQLTVVVAKHGLERRMRTREQDLQTEWRRNAELEERCRKLEEDLAKAKETGTYHAWDMELPLRRKEHPPSTQEASNEDDWTDRPTHLPPEFGYSKLVRWKKRAREGYDHSSENGKKQRTTPETLRLQLAGSESPPQVSAGTDQVAPGASAIDHMIAGEFTESETPARAITPPAG